MCGVLPRRRADGICSQHGAEIWPHRLTFWLLLAARRSARLDPPREDFCLTHRRNPLSALQQGEADEHARAVP